MQFRSTIVWRGAGYGMAASAAPFAIITVVSVFQAVARLMSGSGSSSLLGLAWGTAALACGGALGLLPGLAVGTTLARSEPPAWTKKPAKRPAPRGRAALAAGTAFFVETVAIAFASSGPLWIFLCVFGTPIAAALAAWLAQRIQG
jgi:hypothetical protein